jgi:hypothetical protein
VGIEMEKNSRTFSQIRENSQPQKWDLASDKYNHPFETKNKEMNRNRKILIVSLIVFAFVLVPVLEVGAYSPRAAILSYSKGTVCGNAQLGAWSTSSFTGSSTFLGVTTTFTVNNMVLSGGNRGTVTATSGTVTSIISGKTVAASFNHLSGTYKIVGSKMLVKFKVTSLTVTEDQLFGLTGTLTHRTIPMISIPCNTVEI